LKDQEVETCRQGKEVCVLNKNYNGFYFKEFIETQLNHIML